MLVEKGLPTKGRHCFVPALDELLCSPFSLSAHTTLLFLGLLTIAGVAAAQDEARASGAAARITTCAVDWCWYCELALVLQTGASAAQTLGLWW